MYPNQATLASQPYQYIHPAFRADAEQLTDYIGQGARATIEVALGIGRRMLEAKEKFTRRKEFSLFRAEQDVSPSEARKAMKLVEWFSGFSTDKLVLIHSVTNIFALCHPRYAEVIEKLKSAVVLTKEYVQRLVKEVKEQYKLERKKAAKANDTEGWQYDPSGGGRHYQILYNETTAIEINRLAEERQVLPHRIVDEAIAKLVNPPTEQPSAQVTELKEQIEQMQITHQQQIADVVAEVRSKHIQMQRQLQESARLLESREFRIAELEAEILSISRTSGMADALVDTVEAESELPNTKMDSKPRFKPGDIVRHHTVKSWVYAVVDFKGDGNYEVKKLLGNKLDNYVTVMKEEQLVFVRR